MKETTLIYLIRGGRVLLAMKKRGFGRGKWNAPGGKRSSGETSRACAARELEEETGCTVAPPHDAAALAARGVIEFVFADAALSNRCFLYAATRFDDAGLAETDEMAPRWFALADVPYGDMWEDDVVWLPKVLSGECVHLRFHFDTAGDLIHDATEDLSDDPPVPADPYHAPINQ
jgi:8-oxo-dGTP diphosphatase